MFDRVNAGAQRAVDAAVAMRMGRDLHAQHMGFGDQRVHFGLAILLRAKAGTR